MAVKRFLLNTSELDDATFGLDGFSPPIILDTSLLDGNGLLDGAEFLTIATGASALGELSATATTKTAKSATASANLGGLVASATTKTAKSGIAVANFGGLIASATTKTGKFAIASSDLDGLVATANGAPPAPPPEPTPSGGRRVYSTSPRKKIEPLPQVEIPVIQPKRRYAVASAILNGATCTATSSITFSILDDDAEILLLV
jgi:hypothetical protein